MKKQNVRTLSFIVSTFTYLLIGAAIFDALESQTEENTRKDLEHSEVDYKFKYNISHDDYRTLEDMVIKYHPYRTFPQWKFTGAFYFSLTVITTIGYGHSTPQTILGKTFCMFYAIVGIPLCLVMFQSVGERLNYFASFCIQLVKKCIRFRNTEVNQTEMVCVAGVFAIFVITGGAAMFSHYEGWTYFNSIYYCVITLTTIGFGDYVDKNNLSNTGYVILSFTFILFGLTVVASSINLLVLKFLTMNTDDERREEYTRKAQEKHNETQFGSGELLNVVNGNVLCTFEPADLEDLRRESAFRCCFWRHNSIHVKFSKTFPFLLFKMNAAESNLSETYQFAGATAYSTPVEESRTADESRYYQTAPLAAATANVAAATTTTAAISRSLNSFTSIRSNADPLMLHQQKSATKMLACSGCLNKIRTKKAHYTIRRGPGKISHLLITDELVLETTTDNSKLPPLPANSPKLMFNVSPQSSCGKRSVCGALPPADNNASFDRNLDVHRFIDEDTELESEEKPQTSDASDKNQVDVSLHLLDGGQEENELNLTDQTVESKTIYI